MQGLDWNRIVPIISNPQASRQASQKLTMQGAPPPDPEEIRMLMAPPEQNPMMTPEQAAEGAIQGAAASPPQPSAAGAEGAGAAAGAAGADPKMQALMMALGSYQKAQSQQAPVRAAAAQPRGATPSPQVISDLYNAVGQQQPQSPVMGLGGAILGG